MANWCVNTKKRIIMVNAPIAKKSLLAQVRCDEDLLRTSFLVSCEAYNDERGQGTTSSVKKKSAKMMKVPTWVSYGYQSTYFDVLRH